MNNIPDILEDIKGSYTALCTRHNWELTKAVDPFAVYDILYQNAGRGVIVIGYSGDSLHQQACRSVISKVKFSITVSTRRDLTNPLSNIVKRTDGKISLLEMVEEIKKKTLGLEIDNGLSENQPRYEGTLPLSTPEGYPLDAYQISFWCYVASAPDADESSESSE